MSLTEKLTEISKFLLSKTTLRPKIAIICGSGLGGLGEKVSNRLVIPYTEIPSFPQSTVPGHAGNLIFGMLGNKEVVLMQGRFHAYEGYTTQFCTLPIRVMHVIGVKILMLTNAAGGLNPGYNVGDMMIIKDHINIPGLSGFSPLVGPNDSSLGERFIPLSDAYDQELRKVARDIANDLGESDRCHEGVYAMQLGPCYETVAESRMLRMLGGDTVGMSTTHEVIVARHMKMRVFAMSLVTNKSVLEYDSMEAANHEEVLAASKLRAPIMENVIIKIIEKIEI